MVEAASAPARGSGGHAAATHRSTVAPLLGVIAQKVGPTLIWDGE